ncbi:baseplate J/gp47 family protein [Serratia fonticola]|uniref:Baseplate J/gp47 family protein n=1 Tax=Serratia fonticola TaxID=47917 RepID=A0AAW3WKR8_SERFO|nr:baseplate J/gp47 family protein [Serratia fonticola]MBC3211366.1 baseplate J/gp47 family protein [Serratia fonticola]NYA12348.1 baseplate J/gp47 family protein [Serratia fonticola]NYA31927.1 baseplate J/gp47 family protein [Serratia fonticola]
MADYNFIADNGVIVPDTADIKEGVEQEFKTALGERMSTAPDTPQGRLISAETDARTAVVRNNAQLANQINPNLAVGIFLEAISAFLDIGRAPASYSVIPGVEVTGIPLTQVAKGSRARSRAGDVFAAASAVILNSAGRAVVDFVAAEAGPVTCVPGDLITVVDAVLGWETVYNGNAAVPGEDRQSDESLRLERRVRLANQGISTMEAQISGLYGVPGVKSLSFLENISHNFETVDGIYMKPHSVWACVHGGTDADVAMSLLKNKTDGAGWNGAVSVTVIEPNAEIPYTVLFDRPKDVPIKISVTVRRGTVDQVKAAIMQYVNGEIDGERGFIVGGDVSPFEIAGAINLYRTEIFVKSLLVARAGEPLAATEVAIARNEIPAIKAENINVTVGS